MELFLFFGCFYLVSQLVSKLNSSINECLNLRNIDLTISLSVVDLCCSFYYR